MNFPRSASFGLKVTAATRLGESRCTFDRPPFFSPAHRSLNVSSTGKCRTFVLLSVVKKKKKKKNVYRNWKLNENNRSVIWRNRQALERKTGGGGNLYTTEEFQSREDKESGRLCDRGETRRLSAVKTDAGFEAGPWRWRYFNENPVQFEKSENKRRRTPE